MTTTLIDRVHQLLAEYEAPPGITAAHLLCDRHPANDVAFTIVESDLSSTDLSYGELRERSTRFASALAEIGVCPGDRVATLMGKSAELVIALVGIWRLGAVHVPLFTAFAAPAIAFRVESSGAKVVIADDDQLSKLVPGEDIPANPPWRVVSTGSGADLRMADLLTSGISSFPAAAVGPHGVLIEMFTSGTTGTPKGVPVPLRAVASFHAYQEFGLDVRPDDVYWNAADPGWAYGLFYGIVAPLATGTRSLLLHAGFSADLTRRVLEEFGVTNFAAAPTVYRSMRASGARPLKHLRRASSAGEPLTPDVVRWSREALGTTVHDHYGQTEHGMFISNGWHDALRSNTPAGSMGRPLPGFTVAVLEENSDQTVADGEMGRIVIDTTDSPLVWFTGYVDAPDKTAARYTADGRFFITGDLGTRDEDGYYFFSARDDDVIIMAGYRIGPFDVESALLLHDSVVEAAVVGMPDELRGEILEAFVVLRDGADPSHALGAELQTLVKQKFASHAYPRAVHYVDSLPKTPSGKVQRFLLRQAAQL